MGGSAMRKVVTAKWEAYSHAGRMMNVDYESCILSSCVNCGMQDESGNIHTEMCRTPVDQFSLVFIISKKTVIVLLRLWLLGSPECRL